MAYVADLSFLSDPARLLGSPPGGHLAIADENATRSDLENMLESGKRLQFSLPLVNDPAVFASALFKTPSATPSIDFSAAQGFCPPSASSPAMAMKKGTTTLGFVYKGGVILAVDSRASMGTYISSQTVMKVIEISDIILGTMAGGAADCSYWERHMWLLCKLFELRNGEPIPVAAASNMLANIFFHWRGYGLCCGTMIAGWNAKEEQPELYFVDDKATRLKGDLFSCGSGSTYAYGVLDNEYKWDMTDEEAVELGKRAIYQAAHRDGGSGGVVRVFHIYRGGWRKVIAGMDVSELHYEYAEKKGVPSYEL
ncbi:proteasome subunit beta type [Cystoisospora suis]|uniref:Proteasome subunit beta n=1 Tax=Cystoisospora suis TaxID=483139 RepID=A0A2C6L480_9APIC|nr:proteasome subunit beta type [Cystoisospora suis]